jgi:hypothetical protein
MKEVKTSLEKFHNLQTKIDRQHLEQQQLSFGDADDEGKCTAKSFEDNMRKFINNYGIDVPFPSYIILESKTVPGFENLVF